MVKSAEAFRTISEVAEWLGVPAHVLRFWESKFTQVKPVKRAGGRRYYRPTDMLLLGGIKKLLHDDGMTIKGVQKVLREQGVKHVAALSMPLDYEAPDDQADLIEATAAEPAARSEPVAEAPAETNAADAPADESPAALDFDDDASREEQPHSAPSDLSRAIPEDTPEPAERAPDLTDDANAADTDPQAAPEPGDPASDTRVLEDFAASTTKEPPLAAAATDEDTTDTDAAAALAASEETQPQEPNHAPAAPDESAESVRQATPPDSGDTVVLPGFLHGAAPPIAADASGQPAEDDAPEEPAPPRPDIIDLPADPRDDEVDAAPGLISAMARRRGQGLSPNAAAEAARLRDMLVTLSARLGPPTRDRHPE